MDKTRGSGQGLLRSPNSPSQSPSLPSVSAEGKVKVDKLIEQIDRIVLSDVTKSQESYQNWLHEACKDSDTLKYAVERFHHYWLSNRPAVAKAGVFLCANYMFEVDGQKLRQDLLLCLQKDFENRQEMQAKLPDKFLNAAAFLIEMYTRIRIETLPLAFMITPVFQYLEDLLDGDVTEIELFAHLVISVGPTLQEAQAGDGHHSSLTSFIPLQKLFTKVRSILMSRNLSSQSRLWLLFIMDVSSSGDFEVPSPSLQEFYRNKDQLGNSADTLMKSLTVTLHTSETSNPVNQIGGCSEQGIETGVREKLSEIKISPKSKETASTDKAGNFGPRRSPGKNETVDKRENFRNAFQTDTKGNKGKSYWLHDDRFEKEDTPSRERNEVNFSKPRVSQGNWKQPREDRESKPKASDGNWKQPNRASKGWGNDQTKTGDSVAGKQGEENWEEEKNDSKSRAAGGNWRQPQTNRYQRDREIAQSKPADLALAGHNSVENWD